MAQNRSHAVMQQRREPRESRDDFPTPCWATRALCEFLIDGPPAMSAGSVVVEPACGRGTMARPLGEYFTSVVASDKFSYGIHAIGDFLVETPPVGDLLVTNPPFTLAESFVRRARDADYRAVALLVRTAFLEGGNRFRNLFERDPPAYVLQFAERVPMFKGRLDPKRSTATAYAWVVWVGRDVRETRLRWVPPCRARLERAGDYILPVA